MMGEEDSLLVGRKSRPMWSCILALSLFCVLLESCGGAYLAGQPGNQERRSVEVNRRLSPSMKALLTQAEKGDVEAQFTLAQAYDKGRGIPQSKVEAARWYQKAAEQGDSFSQFYLGNMYWEGQGVSKNEKDAIRWWEMAAVQGYAPAQNSLGKVMATGTKTVRADKVKVYVWLALSSAQGDSEAELHRKSLAKQLSSSQLSQASKLVKEWRPQRKWTTVEKKTP